MNKVRAICIFLIASLFISNIYSQVSNSRVRVSSTPHGDNSLIPRPSDNSEIIKYTLKIEQDSALYSLNVDILEKGLTIEDEFNTIISNAKVFKGNELFFEMIPDIISKPNTMALYIYNPAGSISCRYLFCNDNQQIKYRKIEIVNQSKYGLTPLLLGYVDDKQGKNEKLIDKYSKNNLLTITSYVELQEKIIKNIEKCLLVYHNLSDK